MGAIVHPNGLIWQVTWTSNRPIMKCWNRLIISLLTWSSTVEEISWADRIDAQSAVGDIHVAYGQLCRPIGLNLVFCEDGLTFNRFRRPWLKLLGLIILNAFGLQPLYFWRHKYCAILRNSKQRQQKNRLSHCKSALINILILNLIKIASKFFSSFSATFSQRAVLYKLLKYRLLNE